MRTAPRPRTSSPTSRPPRSAPEAGRVGEDAERKPEEDRARRKWERGAHSVPDARLRRGHGRHRTTLDSRPPPACWQDRRREGRRQRRVRAHRNETRAGPACGGARRRQARSPRALRCGRDPLGPGRGRARRLAPAGSRRDRQPQRREHRPALDRVAQAGDSRLARFSRPTCSRARPRASTRGPPSSCAPAASASTAIAATRS